MQHVGTGSPLAWKAGIPENERVDSKQGTWQLTNWIGELEGRRSQSLIKEVYRSTVHQSLWVCRPASHTQGISHIPRTLRQLDFSVFVFVCVCVTIAPVWRPEATLWESILSYHQVGSRNEAQVIRLGSKCLHLWSHLSDTLRATSKFKRIPTMLRLNSWSKCINSYLVPSSTPHPFLCQTFPSNTLFTKIKANLQWLLGFISILGF